MDLFAARERSADGERLLVPLERARFRPGSEVVLDVVVRNVRVGHAFPEGTLDNRDVWLEVAVRDGRGRLLWQEGGLDRGLNLLPNSHR